MPFEASAWLMILVCFIYMAISINILKDMVRREEDEETEERQDKGFLRKCLEVIGEGIYDGIHSFTRGEVTHVSEPKGYEKIIIFGFVVFAIIVLTAYTGKEVKIAV